MDLRGGGIGKEVVLRKEVVPNGDGVERGWCRKKCELEAVRLERKWTLLDFQTRKMWM
jgi:hypothetical protein